MKLADVQVVLDLFERERGRRMRDTIAEMRKRHLCDHPRAIWAHATIALQAWERWRQPRGPYDELT